MPAYIVAHVTPRDLDGFRRSEYVQVLHTLFAQYGARPIGIGMHELLEGDGLGPMTVIDEFPDIETARAFWNDPEYQRVIPDRQRYVDAQVVLVEGTPPQP